LFHSKSEGWEQDEFGEKKRKEWNEIHKKLTGMVKKIDQHESTVRLLLNQHSLLYSSKMNNTSLDTLEDELLEGITLETMRKYPVVSPNTKKSIAWHIWHAARVEDIAISVLVDYEDQVLHAGDWLKKLNINFIHTGNEMNEEEVATLSSKIDINALLAYRLELARNTQKIIGALKPGQLKQKVSRTQARSLLEQGTIKKEAEWLVEYWEKKSIAGLILMPATRHNFLHLNKSIRIKNKIQR
jgi:hypothetical protein